MRNHFVLRGAGLLSLSEKLSFGGLVFGKHRGYGYIEGGAGFWGNENRGFFDTPPAFCFGGGGGSEIFFAETGSVCFEAGALVYILDDTWKSGGMFQIGWKGYF